METLGLAGGYYPGKDASDGINSKFKWYIDINGLRVTRG